MTSKTEPSPVVKRITLDGKPDQAFALFTAGIAQWWPLATHSVRQDDAASCAIEPRAGGRLFETGRDGAESVWGTVLVWDPPARLVCSWHPGRDEGTAQIAEVTFTADDARTALRLEHRDWRRAGDNAAQIRDRYDQGWDGVLAHYVAAR